MKKFGLGIAACVAAFGMVVTGCNNNLAETQKCNVVSVELGEIGTRHNAILTEFYQLNNTNRAVETGTTEADLEAYFGEYEILLSVSYEEGEEVYVISELNKIGAVNSESAVYIEKIETLVNEGSDSLENLLAEISAVEEEAKENLPSDKFEEFESYADTSKASLVFWTENIETISQTQESCRSIASWWAENKERVLKASLSDAAGAAAAYKKGKENGYSGSSLTYSDIKTLGMMMRHSCS